MKLSGEEYSRRLERLSDTTMQLIADLMGYTKEVAIKSTDLTADDSLTEEQLVQELLKLKEMAEQQKNAASRSADTGKECGMRYLKMFRMPTRECEERYLFNPYNYKVKRTCYTTKYPFGLFRERDLPDFYFTEITIFCGDNGSGKSSILNVIAEKLGLERNAPFNRSDFFDDYTAMCRYQLDRPIPEGSKIITSDGVFEKVLDIRRLNDGIDYKRAELIDEYIAENGPNAQPNRLQGLDDYDRWKRVTDMRNKHRSQSRFLKENLMRNIQERSNGESALAYFVDSIQENALYLLDEPENSLSPQNQLKLKCFIEESAKHYGCQFIISTHSPFLLSLSGANIYDIDETPPVEKAWTELECVRVYHDFFMEQNDKFC